MILLEIVLSLVCPSLQSMTSGIDKVEDNPSGEGVISDEICLLCMRVCLAVVVDDDNDVLCGAFMHVKISSRSELFVLESLIFYPSRESQQRCVRFKNELQI